MVGAGRERKKATEKGTHHETCDLGRGETGGTRRRLQDLAWVTLAYTQKNMNDDFCFVIEGFFVLGLFPPPCLVICSHCFSTLHCPVAPQSRGRLPSM